MKFFIFKNLERSKKAQGDCRAYARNDIEDLYFLP